MKRGFRWDRWHVVLFISSTQIIHCNYARNGVTIDDEATTCPYSMGWYVYRLKGTFYSLNTSPATSSSWRAENGHFKLIQQSSFEKSPSTNSGRNCDDWCRICDYL